MYKFTLQDAMNAPELKAVAGSCASSPQFISLVNQAQRRLLKRGDWFDTDFTLRLCVSGCMIAWPAFVGAIRGLKFAGCFNRPANVFNQFYSFTEPMAGYWGRPGYAGNFGIGNAVVQDANMASTFNDVSGTTGKLIRYYVVNYEDIGKTITINGTQYGGQPLQELDANNNHLNGITLTAAAPYASTSALVTHIGPITRQATTGLAYLYEYDPVANTLRDLAVFQPNETNPRFRRSRILNKPLNTNPPDANGICWTNIDALVKIEFVPVVNVRDYLMIDDFDALKFMFQAINAEEARDYQSSETNIMQAVRELNFGLRNKNLDGQTPVFVDAMMGGGIKSPY